jgi:hypothetical protein
MSEIRANKIAALGADIQFWTGAPTEKLRIDAAGNLCFGDVGALGAYIPPPDGIAPMYSARAWGHIITDATSGAINAIATKLKNVKSVVWGNENENLLVVTFDKPMPSTSYIVVANCNLNATNPLLVSKVNADSTASIMYLKVYNATGNGGSGGGGLGTPTPYLNFAENTTGVPQLLDFAVFA